MKKLLILCFMPFIAGLVGCNGNNADAADRVLYGNVITMDEANPTAKAVAIKDGKYLAVGSKEEVSKYVGKDTKVSEYRPGEYIYPGFMDGHNHVAIFTTLKVNGCTIPVADPEHGVEMGDYVSYAKYMYEFVKKHPDYEVYQGMGFWMANDYPVASILDTYCPTTKPVVLVDAGGHTAWLNTPAIKEFIGDTEEKVDAFISKFSRDCVIVDIDDNPTGYLVETPRFAVTDLIDHDTQDIKEYILKEQATVVSQGFTTITDCSIVNNSHNHQVDAFRELLNENKLKIRYRAYYEITEYCTDSERQAEINKAIQYYNEFKNNEYFQIIGIKAFVDGVPEALTSYTFEAYPESAKKGDGYHGVARWHDSQGILDQKLKDLVYTANKNGLSVQLHTMGNAAVHQGLKAFEYAQDKLAGEGVTTKVSNALAHLAQTFKGTWDGEEIDDFELMKKTNTTAITAPHWASVKQGTIENEEKSFGEKGAKDLYKVKSYVDKGINTVYHTDGMAPFGVPQLMYSAASRLETLAPEISSVRGEDEKLYGLESLKCLTTNVAKLTLEENSLGQIKTGYKADIIVTNVDYTSKEVCENWNAFALSTLVTSIVNGNDVYTVL